MAVRSRSVAACPLAGGRGSMLPSPATALPGPQARRRSRLSERRLGSLAAASVLPLGLLLLRMTSPWPPRHSGDGGDTDASSWRHGKGAARTEALVLPQPGEASPLAAGVAQDDEPERIRLLDVPFVEFQVTDVPWRVTKLLVPTVWPLVARWWSQEDDPSIHAHPETSLTGDPQIHIEVIGREPLEVDGVCYRGIHTAVRLSEDVEPEKCRLRITSVLAAEIPGFEDLGAVPAVFITCPSRQDSRRRGSVVDMLHTLMASPHHPLKLLLLPWLLLLLPFVMVPSGPLTMIGGACLVIAFLASISFLLTVFIHVAHRHFSSIARRWRRYWYLCKLARRPTCIVEAFGVDDPCCICLGEPEPRESLITLLPCRHSLHDECYRRWVYADAYFSVDLVCPLCRHRVDEIGKLSCRGGVP